MGTHKASSRNSVIHSYAPSPHFHMSTFSKILSPSDDATAHQAIMLVILDTIVSILER